MLKLKRGNKRKFIFKNKDGQFFILVAIIVCMIIFLLVKNYNYIMESIELKDFEEVSAGYNREGPKVINYAIYKAPADCVDPANYLREDCPAGALDSFTKDYVDYGKTKDPNYGLIWMYVLPDDSIIIKNLLNPDTGEASLILTAVDSQGNKISGANAQVLLSEQDTSTGSICINGLGNVGCGSATTSVSNFGQSLTQTEIKDAKEITLKIGVTEAVIPLKRASGEPINYNTLQTRRWGEGDLNVDVKICQDGFIYNSNPPEAC